MAWTKSKEAVIKLEQLLRCLNCDKVMDEPQTLGGCDHHICRGCISAVLSGSSCECPVCGLPAWPKDLKTNKQMDNLIKLVLNLKTLLIDSTVSTSQISTVTNSQPCMSSTVNAGTCSNCASLVPLRDNVKTTLKGSATSETSEGVLKSSQLVRKTEKRSHLLRGAMTDDLHLSNQLEPKEASGKCVLGAGRHPPTIQSSLLTSRRSFQPHSTQLLTAISCADSVLGKRDKTTCLDEQQAQHKKQHSYVLEETTANIPPLDVEFPFSPLVTRTRNYSKLDKHGKLLRLHQSGLRRGRKKDKTELTQSDFLVTPTIKKGTNSGSVVKEGKAPPPATPTTMHARTMRRNIRGETPLHVASIKGDVAEVCMLLKQGADPNVKDNAGWTPLHEACNHGHINIVTELLDHNALINTPGFDNDTPLHDAVANGHVDTARLLLQRGASTTVRNQQGLTAEDLAVSDMMKEVFTRHSCLQVSPNAIVSPHVNPQMNCDATNVVLLCTGLKPYQKKQVEDAAGVLGAQIVTSFSLHVSHVVTSCNQAMCCSRTLKFLCGVATGKWIVSLQWVVDSLKNQGWTNEVNYEIAGVTVGDSNLISEAPRKGRENADRKLPGLFGSCDFFLYGAFGPPQASKNELSKLIYFAGGTVLSSCPSNLSSTSDKKLREKQGSTFIVHDPCFEKNAWRPFTNNSCRNVRIVPATWVLDCISCFELISP